MKEATAVQENTRLHQPESGAPFNVVEDVIYRRRSVRAYQKRQVPEYLVRRVLEAGRFAPSSGNAQTWKFIVIRDAQLIEEMEVSVAKSCRLGMKFSDYIEPGGGRKEWVAKILMRFLPHMFHPIPFAVMKLIADGKFRVWHDAPTVIFLLADMRSPGDPAVDIGIAGQNMVLTAHSFGLGTCWVSFCTPLNMDRKWKRKMGIRYPYKLVTSITLGYPRGVPDGYVPRETHAIDWYGEDGTSRVLY